MPITRSNFKWIVGASVVLGLTLGLAAGVFSDGSPSRQNMVLTGIAVWAVGHLLFGLWVRSREQPKAGDRKVLPNLWAQSIGLLLISLPRLFWPGAERVHIAAAILACVLVVFSGQRQFRRQKRLRMLREKKGHL